MRAAIHSAVLGRVIVIRSPGFNPPALSVILRHAVGAIPGAVPASDAGVGRVQYQPRQGVFGVRGDRAAFEARRLQAVIAAHGEVQPLCVGVRSTLDLSHLPPVDFEGISVLFGTGDFAAAAADALRHVEMEPVLFARLRRPLRDQRHFGADAHTVVGMSLLRPFEQK